MALAAAGRLPRCSADDLGRGRLGRPRVLALRFGGVARPARNERKKAMLRKAFCLPCFMASFGLAGCASSPAAPPLIPRQWLFGNAEQEAGQIGPDKAWLAYLAPVDGVLNLHLGHRGRRGEAFVRGSPGRRRGGAGRSGGRRPELFACGISVVGPSSLETLLASIPLYWDSPARKTRWRLRRWPRPSWRIAWAAAAKPSAAILPAAASPFRWAPGGCRRLPALSAAAPLRGSLIS